MSEPLDHLREEIVDRIGRSVSEVEVEQLRVEYLGRKGTLTGLLRGLKDVSAEERPQRGEQLNRLRSFIEEQIAARLQALKAHTREKALGEEQIDITLPGSRWARGRIHPLTLVMDEIVDVFLGMGFEIARGPDIEDDYHNFEALNMPKDHPARDMQDTFYLKGAPGLVLRTHTSTAQIRYMLDNPHPPRVRIICPGKVYRRDDDITHSPMFQQVEALVVGPEITLGDLKGTIEAFLHALFGPQHPIRFRASFFPYTEPSMEADLACVVCGGKGCRVCKGTGWLEIMGSGMVHPAVFEAVNARLGRVAYDPEKVTGFAFGLGIERVAMVRHAIDNIRLFYENDLRFLEQFG
jgi:phenylalanyl-tRNA synthetase alpha chain